MATQKPAQADCPKGDRRADKNEKPASPAHDNTLRTIQPGAGKAKPRLRTGKGGETHQSAPAVGSDAADHLTTNHGIRIATTRTS